MADIRKPKEAEIPRLVEILRGTYLGTMAAIVPAKALEAFHAGDAAGDFARRFWQDFYVIEAEKTDHVLAGLLFVVENKVESLHIHPDSARRGYGARLLAYGEDLIAEKHAFAELEVLAGNKNARDFYEAHGWQAANEFIGLEVGEVPAPMVLMKKRLPVTRPGRDST